MFSLVGFYPAHLQKSRRFQFVGYDRDVLWARYAAPNEKSQHVFDGHLCALPAVDKTIELHSLDEVVSGCPQLVVCAEAEDSWSDLATASTDVQTVVLFADLCQRGQVFWIHQKLVLIVDDCSRVVLDLIRRRWW